MLNICTVHSQTAVTVDYGYFACSALAASLKLQSCALMTTWFLEQCVSA